ncbi:hypothetical protein [Longispora albida]|uniref:hypothetical protein n=1 Tax=Longispora albida TaxID=203523 RepID=UPI00035C2608|nr:hypothetical protein [Longispora albida]
MFAIVCISPADLVHPRGIAAQARTLAGFLRRHEAVLVCGEPGPGEGAGRILPATRMLLDRLREELPGRSLVGLLVGTPPDPGTLGHLRDLTADGATPVALAEPHALEACAYVLLHELGADTVFTATPSAGLQLAWTAQVPAQPGRSHLQLVMPAR